MTRNNPCCTLSIHLQYFPYVRTPPCATYDLVIQEVETLRLPRMGTHVDLLHPSRLSNETRSFRILAVRNVLQSHDLGQISIQASEGCNRLVYMHAVNGSLTARSTVRGPGGRLSPPIRVSAVLAAFLTACLCSSNAVSCILTMCWPFVVIVAAQQIRLRGLKPPLRRGGAVVSASSSVTSLISA
jgi:hypothetical protein